MKAGSETDVQPNERQAIRQTSSQMKAGNKTDVQPNKAGVKTDVQPNEGRR